MGPRLTRPQELAAPGPHRRPEVGGELLGVLVLQDELGDGALPQGAGRSHGPDAALLLHQLTVHQGDQLPLHRPAQHALGGAAQTHPWRARQRDAGKGVLARPGVGSFRTSQCTY